MKVLLDIEALKVDDFQHSFLDSATRGGLSQKENFLASFLDNEKKVIRKIDRVDSKVESALQDLILELVSIYNAEQFQKTQIKIQKDFHIKDVFLEVLKLSDSNYADSSGI